MLQKTYNTIIGEVTIEATPQAVTALYIGKPKESIAQGENDVMQQAIRELTAYLAGELQTFTTPLAPQGTDFQQRVWQALQVIPYGQTKNYKQVAELIGNANASRAVGNANNKNPILIMIPCHRVIGANGKLVGYGAGLPLKEHLLNLEKKL
ncbi:Methylated-DNA--protein-cysteine methyltransferase [Metalysinibacillus saudimassiliensis]|uniref:Methylated-DNA--protein-cysteine methyltransferase n=1 Tax=Metalysinibacillus saudimassiliensis TaxID=1461583 RepID=A0A078MMB3_9BACL|nr:Methylated-DNA--protein-cysteine methyltransferase [Metalysinibacillus saudimassiliensis]